MNKYLKKILHPIVGLLNYGYLKHYYCHITGIDQDTRVANRVLIISPHQDDETIGMGATILKLKRKGAYVKVLYTTNGVQEPINSASLELGAVRRDEALKVAELLGVDSIDTLDYNIMTLIDKVDSLSEHIQELLNTDIPYDRIYTPALSEMHIDHVASSLALMKALSNTDESYDTDIYMYEINNSLQEGSINIVETFYKEIADIKKKAFDIYASQVNISFEVLDLIQISKAYITKDGSYGAEVFYKMSKEDFLNIDTSSADFPFTGMKNATNFMRLIKNYSHNSSYRQKIKKLLGKTNI